MNAKERDAIKERVQVQVTQYNRALDYGSRRFGEQREALVSIMRLLASMDIFTNVSFAAEDDAMIDRVTLQFPDSPTLSVVYDRRKEVALNVCCG